jgi:RNA polymerase sigma-70 factor (ECF subfamily)
MANSTDRSLVNRTLAGNPQAFGELVQRYQNSVFNVCYRLLGERPEAEDLTQDAFIRAFQRLSTYDTGREFGPWIRRLAANLCYNHLKKKRFDQTILDDEFETPKDFAGADPESSAVLKEQSESIQAALIKLPPHYRIVLELRHFQMLSYGEMAIELGLPVNTVKSHLFRGRKQLAKLLKESIHE